MLFSVDSLILAIHYACMGFFCCLVTFVTSEDTLVLFSHISNSKTHVSIAGSYCSSGLCIIHFSVGKNPQSTLLWEQNVCLNFN